MRIIFLFFNIIILSFGKIFWRLYDTYDDEIINNEILTSEKKNLNRDINLCRSDPLSCNIMNDELYSTGNFANKCCFVQKTKEYSKQNYIGCLSIFSGKYFESSLYSLALLYDSKIYYECDSEKGFKMFDPSTYIPYETWEIMLKDKYDCIYSRTEKECKATAKSLSTKNLKCVWFSYNGLTPRTQCYGVQEITDYEFRRLIPYFIQDNLYLPNKTLNFSCYGKSDKSINGTFDLKYNSTMIENYSYENKLAVEMGSNNAHISKRQSLIGIEGYQIKDYLFHIFLYTSAPLDFNNYYFTIIIKIYEKRTNRNLQEKDEEYKEQIVTCFQESKSNNEYFQIILSKCSFPIIFYETEKIKIETGFDLIGNFDEKKNTIFEGMQFMNYTDKEKIKDECSIFSYGTFNMDTYKLIGDTTLERKNVKFYFYYSKDLKVQIIQAKGSFLNESSIVDFEMSPSVDLEKGNVFIPSQVCQAENGEYLYIDNSYGSIYQNYMNIYSVDIINSTTIPTTIPTTVATTAQTTTSAPINTNNYDNYNDDTTNNLDTTEELEEKNETWIRVSRGENLFTTGFFAILISSLLWLI